VTQCQSPFFVGNSVQKLEEEYLTAKANRTKGSQSKKESEYAGAKRA
jgi:hypothetical protein